MSTSLREVIEAGGFNLSTTEDANWLLSKRTEFAELIEQAEELVGDADEAECEHEDTYFEDIENTAEYELNQAIGNTSAPLVYDKIEVCEDCGAQRSAAGGEWENVN